MLRGSKLNTKQWKHISSWKTVEYISQKNLIGLEINKASQETSVAAERTTFTYSTHLDEFDHQLLSVCWLWTQHR